MNQDVKSCSNCEYGDTMCGMRFCRMYEGYVDFTGACSWWTRKVEKEFHFLITPEFE